MTTDAAAWPRKTRELCNQLLDSRMWNGFRFRPDDVVIATYAKAGTTWTQQIVAQLIFGGREGIDVATLSPWLDLRVPPKEVKLAALEAQRHRRFIKSHLPVDALVFSPEAKYIYVGRDGRDVVWSFYNHHANANDDWYRLYNDTPGRVGPPIARPPASVRQYFLEWLEGDGYPLWSFWDNVSSWWAIRHLPNVLFLHFADLKRDLPGQMRRVAAFLEIDLDKTTFDAAVRHCGFDYMKTHAAKHAPHRGRLFKGGARAFIHKGTNGRWRDVLSAADCHRYEAAAEERLGSSCARWLAEGGALDQDLALTSSRAAPPLRFETSRSSSGPRGAAATVCGHLPRITKRPPQEGLSHGQHPSRQATPRARVR
jgi:aryl sulfotransferase